MFWFKNNKKRRESETTSNIITASHINVNKINNKLRLMNITESELKDYPWLLPLKQSADTITYIPPNTRIPSTATCIDRISEQQLKNKQGDNEVDYSSEDFHNSIKLGTFEANYKRNPIVDENYWKIVQNNEYKVSDNNDLIDYIRIKNYEIEGKSGVGNSSAVQIFSINEGIPTSEPIRIDFSKSPTACTTFGQDLTGKEFYIPFAKAKTATLIAILYTLEEVDDETIEKPIAIGRYEILNYNEKEIRFEWVIFESNKSLDDHLLSEKKFPMFNLVLDSVIGETPKSDEEFEKMNVNTTSFSPMYPSQLLTIYNTKLKFKQETNTKMKQLFCKFSLKTKKENAPSDPFCVAAKSSCDKLKTVFVSSTVKKTDQTCLPETISFKLNSRYDMQLYVCVEVYSVESKKVKFLFDTLVPLEMSHGTVKGKFKDHSLFHSTNNSITFSYLFPYATATPNSLMLSLISPPKAPDFSRSQEDLTQQMIKIPDYDHPMFQDIAPYILQYCFDPEIIKVANFRGIADIFTKCKDEWLYKWIEHQFTCSKDFVEIYIKYLTENISDIDMMPVPFFCILLKTLVVSEDEHSEKIRSLLMAAAEESIPLSVKKAVGHFLKLLRMFFLQNSALKHALVFISHLKASERAEVFTILFTDPAFILSILPNKEPKYKNTFSPYCPLLSLFFSTVQESFLANNKVAIQPVVTTIGVLGATVESYLDEIDAKKLAFYLFPLLSLVFTFLDSLIPHIGDDPSLVPFLLFIFLNNNKGQFISYYNLLSDYSKLRFLDFLSSLSASTTVNQLKGRIIGIGDNELSIAHEITWRLLHFLRFIEKIPTLQERPLASMINILIHMTSPQQDSESFPMVFSSFAFIVNKFSKDIFVDQTSHILPIISTTVSLTQRKLAAARITATGFLRWIVEQEKSTSRFKKSQNRCYTAICLAVVESLFQNENFNFMASSISKDFTEVDELAGELSNALHNGKVYLQQTSEMINIVQQLPIYGCKYLIFKKVVALDEENDDYTAAFVTQWRICALIADVFFLKKEKIYGIPSQGSSAFPYLYSLATDSPIRASQGGFPDTYLNLEGPMFTEENINKEMQRTLELCQKASIHWLAGSVTSFLLNYLEAHRKFDDLQLIFHKISESYTELAQFDVPKIDFYLIMYRGEIAKEFMKKNYIHVFQQSTDKKDYLREYIDKLKAMYPGLEEISYDSGFILEKSKCKEKSGIQIVKVNYDSNQLDVIKATTFTYDIVEKEGDWMDNYVTRYTVEAEMPLPGLLSFSGVKSIKKTQIKRLEFYEEVLITTAKKIKAQVDEFRAVMPPEKLKQLWTKWSLWLNTNSLIQMIDDTIGATPKNAALGFVKMLKVEGATEEELGIEDLDEEVKEKLEDYVSAVWKQIANAINVINDIYLLNNRDRAVSTDGFTGDPKVEPFRKMVFGDSFCFCENV